MDRLHSTMSAYIKSMSKRKEGDDKEKVLPVDMLAQAMIAHGEEFEQDSLFGTCLTGSFCYVSWCLLVRWADSEDSDGTGE